MIIKDGLNKIRQTIKENDGKKKPLNLDDKQHGW